MGFISQGAAGPNIYATDMEDKPVLLYSQDLNEMEARVGQQAPIATRITAFTDEHPLGAKSRVELTGFTLDHNFTDIENIGFPQSHYYNYKINIKENAEEILDLYSQAKVSPPKLINAPSRTGLSLIFDNKIKLGFLHIAHLVLSAPVPRV